MKLKCNLWVTLVSFENMGLLPSLLVADARGYIRVTEEKVVCATGADTLIAAKIAYEIKKRKEEDEADEIEL